MHIEHVIAPRWSAMTTFAPLMVVGGIVYTAIRALDGSVTDRIGSVEELVDSHQPEPLVTERQLILRLDVGCAAGQRTAIPSSGRCWARTSPARMLAIPRTVARRGGRGAREDVDGGGRPSWRA
jgi:hypothetical protein